MPSSVRSLRSCASWRCAAAVPPMTGSRRCWPKPYCTRRPGRCGAARARSCAALSPAASGCAEAGCGMPETILYDSAMRLFGDLVTPEVLAAAEQGIWPEALWRAVEEAGYPEVIAAGPSAMVEAVTILRAAGYHAAPIPLAETMLARWLCAACGVDAPVGALTIGPVEAEDRLDIAEAAVSGHAGYIPWGREVAAVVLIAGNTLLVAEQQAVKFTP